MKVEISSLQQSATLKVAIIGFLILLMLIPIGMISGLVGDRSAVAAGARHDISRSWGGSQLITGPIVRATYTVERQLANGGTVRSDRSAYLLADSLNVTADVDAELRRRGIHEMPVFNAALRMNGSFDLGQINKLVASEQDLQWQSIDVLIGITDASTVTSNPMVQSEDLKADFDTTAAAIAWLPPLLAAEPDSFLEKLRQGSNFDFEIVFDINGSEALEFLPFANDAKVEVTSNWASPSFVGKRLPGSHDIRDDGFNAAWTSTSLGRAMPEVWGGDNASAEQAVNQAFGVRLIQPVGIYQLLHRALNYAVLFIGLSFVTYFMMEIISASKLHPLQYLLVGFANAMFYLLLLSFAEHIGFGVAYLVSALASSLLILCYSRSVLLGGMQVAAMAMVLSSLYVYLYMTLQAEKFALLAGSVGLWIILAAIMYLTRRIDWYSLKSS